MKKGLCTPKTLLLVASLFCLSSVARALDDTPENRSAQADRYMLASSPQEMLRNSIEQMTKNMPEDRKTSITRILVNYLDMDALNKGVKDAMVKNFSADELQALADFYGSTVGKSAMKKHGAYMADLMPVIQNEMTKAQAKAMEAQKAPAK